MLHSINTVISKNESSTGVRGIKQNHQEFRGLELPTSLVPRYTVGCGKLL